MGLCADAEDFELVSLLNSDLWTILVPLSPLGAGYKETQKTLFRLDSISQRPVTHLRINMGPDGGIARLRAYGKIQTNLTRPIADKNGLIDLAAVENGGLALVATFTSILNWTYPII
jgi:allantoicase